MASTDLSTTISTGGTNSNSTDFALSSAASMTASFVNYRQQYFRPSIRELLKTRKTIENMLLLDELYSRYKRKDEPISKKHCDNIVDLYEPISESLADKETLSSYILADLRPEISRLVLKYKLNKNSM